MKMIAIDGIIPTNENITNETYPLSHYVYMITKGLPDSSEIHYLNFLRSEDGQKLIAKDGKVAPLRM